MTEEVQTPKRDTAERLQHYVDNIERWRAEAKSLRARVDAGRGERAEVDQLVGIEETADAIYREIADFRETVDEIAARSPEAAAELAGVSDALHLVLLEITELGIGMYQTHSGL